MINKFQNLSLGKKVYSILWMFWVAFLAILVGMLAGLNKTMNSKVKPKNGWNVSLDQKVINDLNVKYNDDTFKGQKDWATIYKVKDIAASQKNLQQLKMAILNDAGIQGKLTNVTTDKSLAEIKDAILNLKIGPADKRLHDKVAINAFYKNVYSDKYTVYEDLSKARLDESFKLHYDTSIGRLGTTYLTPLVLNDNIVSRAALRLDDYPQLPSHKAKKAQNATAAVGFVFLAATIAAIFATVIVTVKEKKGGK